MLTADGLSGAWQRGDMAGIPEQRQAQERLWRALTKLDAIDQPGAPLNLDRETIELEVMVAWTEYENSHRERVSKVS